MENSVRRVLPAPSDSLHDSFDWLKRLELPLIELGLLEWHALLKKRGLAVSKTLKAGYSSGSTEVISRWYVAKLDTYSLS